VKETVKISTRLRYGLRLLVDLAIYSQGYPLKLKDVSRRQHISLPYLRQLALLLEASGMIRSLRGNKGGYLLGRPPEKISLLEVATILEGPLHLVECADNPNHCQRSSQCMTRELWYELTSQIRQVLAGKTLSDFIPKEGERNDLPRL